MRGTSPTGPGGVHRALFLPAFLLALLPIVAQAQVEITSRHQADRHIEGSDLSWLRVGSTRPLTLRITGPGTLRIRARKEVTSGARTPTLLHVFRDRRRVAKLRLLPAQAVPVSGRDERAGAAKVRSLTIPGGSHRIRIKVVQRGHVALVAYTYASQAAAIPPVVALTEPEDVAAVPLTEADVSAVPLVPLDDEESGSAADVGAIPLVSLASDEASSDAAPTEGAPAIAAVDLVPLVDETESSAAKETGAAGPALADAGNPVTVESIEATTPPPTGGVLIGAPIAGEHPPPVRGRGHLLMNLCFVTARVGLDTGALGGGVDLLYRPGLLSGDLLVGLSFDYLPQRLVSETAFGSPVVRRFDVGLQTLPVLLTGLYELRLRALRVLASASLGLSWVQVSVPGRKGSALHPAAAIAVGPALDLGPGLVTASLRLSASYGKVESRGTPERTELLTASTLGTAALTLGYALSF